MPLQYFALEILLEEASKTLKRGVLSMEECLKVASGLHFDRHSLSLALQFLDDISVVLYFPEVLEGVVFVDPQVLLDKATELVEAIHRLRRVDSDGCSVELKFAEWQIFKDHGLFDLQVPLPEGIPESLRARPLLSGRSGQALQEAPSCG